MLRPIITPTNMITLIKGLIFPNLFYLCNVWGTANHGTLKTVERLLKTAIRLTMRHKTQDSVTDRLNELGWLGPNQMCYRSIACTMFKLLNSEDSPTHLKELFRTSSEMHSHNTR